MGDCVTMLINYLPMLVLDAHKMLGFDNPRLTSLKAASLFACLCHSVPTGIPILCRLVNDRSYAEDSIFALTTCPILWE